MTFPYTTFAANHVDITETIYAATINAIEAALNDVKTVLGSDPDGAYADLTVRLSRQVGLGGLLACTVYNPGVAAALSTSDTTAAAATAEADATNLKVNFTAPASGRVLVRLNGCVLKGTAAGLVVWTLRDSTAEITAARCTVDESASNTNRRRYATSAVVSGLVAGTAYSWKWAHYTAANAVTLEVGGSYGPAVMEVLAA